MAKLCGVCQKNEVWYERDVMAKCVVCGIPLCFECRRMVKRQNPNQDVIGVPTSPLKPAQSKKILCPKCLNEVEDPAEL